MKDTQTVASVHSSPDAPRDDGFVARLRILVDEHKSIRAFAGKVGVGDSVIRKYLDGSSPSIDKAAAIAAGSGVSLEWLITGQGEMRPPVGSGAAFPHEAQGGPDTLENALDDAERALMARQDAPFAPGSIPEDAQRIKRDLELVAKEARDPKLLARADYLLSRAFGDEAASTRVAERQQTSIDRIRASGHLVRRALHAVDWPTAPLGIFEALKTLAYGYQIAPEDLETALAMIKAEWDHRDRP